MKKFISAVLCVAMLAFSVCSVSAAEKSDDSQTGITMSDVMNIYQVKGTDTIENNRIKAYTYGVNIDSTSGLVFYEHDSYYNSDKPIGIKVTPPPTGQSNSNYLPLSSSKGYVVYHLLQGGASNYVHDLCFNNTGGTYEKLRINLSKYSNYFASNGTHPESLADINHAYNFTDEGNGFTSSLVIISGGAINFVAPDQNGMAEIYVSTNIGQETRFKTDFSYRSSTISSGGGGTNGEVLTGLTMGDVNKDDDVYVSDATKLQKYLIGTETLDSLSLRNADVNRDGICNIVDATLIQKYVAKV